MAGKGEVSMMDTLKKMLADLALAQTASDADPDFLSKLQQVLVQRLRQPQPAATGGPGSMAGGPPGSPPGMPPGVRPPGVQGPPVGPGSLTPGLNPGMGAPDEIRRMIGAGAPGAAG